MDLGNLGGLYLTVPWRSLEVVHERRRVLLSLDLSLYGARLGPVLEEVEVFRFDQLSDLHVTPSYQNAKAGDLIDVWRLRGSPKTPSANTYSFLLLEQHLALYRGVLESLLGGLRPRSLNAQVGAACRLHGASGSGKTYAQMYILFRELASGRGCMVARRTGRLRLLFWLKPKVEASGCSTTESANCGDEECSDIRITGTDHHAAGSLVQVTGFETPSGKLEVQYLRQGESEEADYVEWERLRMRTAILDPLVGTMIRRGQKRFEVTKEARIALLDGATPATHRLAVYVPVIVLTGFKFIPQPHNEWFWAGMSAVQVAVCRESCWRTFRHDRELTGSSAVSEADQLPCLTGYALYEKAGVDLRTASVICYWDNCEWVRPPVEHILSHLQFTDLIAVLEVGQWSEDWAKRPKSNIVKCQLRPGATEDWKFEPGTSCLPFMQKLAASELVRKLALKRIAWFPMRRLLAYSEHGQNPLIFAALVRHIVYASGFSPKQHFSSKKVVSVPAGIDIEYSATSEAILSEFAEPSASQGVCYVSNDVSRHALILKLPRTTKTKRARSRNFVLVSFKVPSGKNALPQAPHSDCWHVHDDAVDFFVHARLGSFFSAVDAVDFLRQQPERGRHLVWRLMADTPHQIVADDSVRPHLQWYFHRLMTDCTVCTRG